MNQPALFEKSGRELLGRQTSDWRPSPPPELNGEKLVVLNAETTGLQWWEKDRPIGWSYVLPESGRKGYLPIRHEVGSNLETGQVLRWLTDLKNCDVFNVNTKFDLHMSRVDGVDLTEQNNRFGDAAHLVGLLDDNRKRFKLDEMSKDLLGWDVELDGLGKLPKSLQDESEFRYLHPGLVAPYAERNVEQVLQLMRLTSPQIEAEDLGRVLALERDVIPVVVEMEKNGTFLDVPLLYDMRDRARREVGDLQWKIRQESGVPVGSFDAAKDLERVLDALKLPVVRTATGQASVADATLKEYHHPVIEDWRRGGQLSGLLSMYLDKYAATVRSDGWLRFNLHQLKSTKGEGESVGTVSGRFSGAGDKYGGYNPQQVVGVEKQVERGWCTDYVVRKLFLMNFAADAMQIEYRMFAHYANDPQILAVYAANPLADYHAVVMELLHRINDTLNRKQTKNTNFAKIYGAGLVKFAFMIGEISEQVYLELAGRLAMKDWSVLDDPRLARAKEINDAYNKMFPAVKPLLKKASDVAQQRGYVCDLIGRRARLHNRFHSALNRVIQGGAASVNKKVLVEAYKVRKKLGLTMRLTVHDELTGNLADKGVMPELMKVLNTQYFDLRVPILWDGKVGANWAECK